MNANGWSEKYPRNHPARTPGGICRPSAAPRRPFSQPALPTSMFFPTRLRRGAPTGNSEGLPVRPPVALLQISLEHNTRKNRLCAARMRRGGRSIAVIFVIHQEPPGGRLVGYGLGRLCTQTCYSPLVLKTKPVRYRKAQAGRHLCLANMPATTTIRSGGLPYRILD